MAIAMGRRMRRMNMGSIGRIDRSCAGPSVLAITRVAGFLAEEGDVLRDLLNSFDRKEAANMVHDLVELCREETPNTPGITIALGIVLEALEQVSAETIDQIAQRGQGPRDLDKAVLWYGAKISDLLQRLQR
ncbi:hypothetical protein R3X27_24935 [Tropicimonas sp. TH_r6]|uniref:hypothetical protein n=1 Tax=Tropicimonas sp. TH_r6 TaxID=3082085 RepID=UPI0029544B97|nr:hypothetical protein [Tropicimonas sp. TH_r6]MDV7145935.1 hypothetical protein [Tropicimonas sp. TH_r6]